MMMKVKLSEENAPPISISRTHTKVSELIFRWLFYSLSIVQSPRLEATMTSITTHYSPSTIVAAF